MGLLRTFYGTYRDFLNFFWSLEVNIIIKENLTNIIIKKNTGLDPAGPLFENYDPRARLDPEDADLVDVIHSNGEKIYMGGLGAWDPMGDIDFYPNGGRMQKGCTNLFFGAVSDMFTCNSIEFDFSF